MEMACYSWNELTQKQPHKFGFARLTARRTELESAIREKSKIFIATATATMFL